MTSLNLQNLKENSKEILKSEIGALLFNLGKTHIGFWEKKYDEKRKHEVTFFKLDGSFDDSFKEEYGYRVFDWYKGYFKKDPDGKCPFELDLEKAGGNVKPLLMDADIKIKLEGSKEKSSEDFKLVNVINGDGDAYKHDFIDKIMFKGCENVNSGIDKGSPKRQLDSLNIVNAFGSIKEKITDTDEGRSNYDKKRIDFLKGLGSNNFDFGEDLIEIREYVQREVKEWYSHLLSDSRFPINDITLWDQAYMTSSMFKAALAAISLDGSVYDDYMNDPRKVKWSILGIQYDKLGLAEKAMNPRFIKCYREKASKVDKKIKELIEVNYALGNEIYRDETGIYFIVPENICAKHSRKGDDVETLYHLNDSLIELQDEIVNCFEVFSGEVFPAVFLTEPSRGTMNIAYLLKSAKKNFLKPVYPKTAEIEKLFKLESPGHFNKICDVCGVRLAEEETNGLKLCGICAERKRDEENEPIDKSNQETVFTGEIQDKNGRIALVTLKFELGEWLDGNMLNLMLRNKNVDDSLKKLERNIKTNLKCNVEDSVIKDLVYEKDLHKEKIQDYCERILIERTIGDEWEKLLEEKLGDKINFKGRKLCWEKIVGDKDALGFLSEILIQFLIRKNPSPARFRRIWETTEEFFIELQRDLCNIFEMKNWRNKRIKFRNIVDKQYKNREFEYKGLNFTADADGNLYLISSVGQAVPLLKKSSIKNEDAYSEIGDEKSDWISKEKIELTDMDDNSKHSITLDNAEYITYKPYISIIRPTPISWQFIMPAEYVPEVIKEVKEKYNKDFKYVKGKLPLHIGIVFQDYKRPLYIGIKALRNMRRDIYNWDSIRYRKTGKELKAYLGTNEEDKLSREYYSLFQLDTKISHEDNKIYRFYLPKQGEENILLKDVDDASEDETYYIYPNTIDFELLDTNIRRNDISYNYEINGSNAKRAIDLKSDRPYTWEEWQSFEELGEYFRNEKKVKCDEEKENEKTNNTKLQSMISLIYSKFNDWKGSENQNGLAKFMLSAFINTFELKNDEMKNLFAKILGVSDWKVLEEKSGGDFNSMLYKFLDMYDFWHHCLKEDIKDIKKELK